uniref:F-box domain-containing protein n=1 Tax=Kalanchoe fedtschenkoi TaxID=63787 RepID=A0A7N0UZZ2_KALFE
MEEEAQRIFRAEAAVPYLPDEVTTQIFIKLPVKTLMRLKTVCRRWRWLISDPQFVSKHLRLSVKSDHTLKLLTKQADGRFGYASIRALDENVFAGFEAVNLGTPFPTRRVILRGSCNGLLFVEVGVKEFHLWNPLTREVKSLPSMPGVVANEIWIRGVLGLGFDEINEDYKVIFAFEDDNATKQGIVMRHMLYSLRADAWRDLHDVGMAIKAQYDTSLAFNGALHWFSYKDDDSGDSLLWYIVAFDMASERFREIGLPDKLVGRFPVQKLCVNGCLGVVESHTLSTTYHLWALKNYDDEGSWSLLYRIPSSWPIHFNRLNTGVFWVSQKGVVLVSPSFDFFLFDPMDCSVKQLPFDFNAILLNRSFVESLVSPNRI